jgi:hypothetical protein
MSVIRIKKENVRSQQIKRAAKLESAGRGCNWPEKKGPAAEKQFIIDIRNNKSNFIHN